MYGLLLRIVGGMGSVRLNEEEVVIVEPNVHAFMHCS